MIDRTDRRQFIRIAGIGAAAFAGSKASPVVAASLSSSSSAQSFPFELGMASYTFRQFPLDQALAMTKRLGLKRIALKGDFHLKLDSTNAQIEEAVNKVKAAGLDLYGGGVIYMKDEAEVNRAFDYAKAAGMRVIIGCPDKELLGLVDKKVKEFDIKIAIHNHGPNDPRYPTPDDAYDKIKKLDRRIGLCIDVGHTQRAGVDPADAAQQFADRLHDIHVKDVSEATEKGQTVEIGRGVIDIPKLLRTLRKINYQGSVSLEYEKDAKDPLAGAAESIGYLRGVLKTI